nr:hypothetical protein [Eubacterium sp.]
MFGYVMVNKPELKIREYERYKGFYCGLCRELKCQYGRLSQLTLTYDMTFLILLLSSLYEPSELEERHICLVHPGKKQRMIGNEFTMYAADMNVLLSYYHFEDDWKDEKKIAGWLGSQAFRSKAMHSASFYPRKAKVIQEQLGQLAKLEKENVTNIDEISRPFGELMSELFVYKEDAFEVILRRFGYFLGKYIYLLDAYMDVEEDYKKECFNPFLGEFQEDGFSDKISQILEHTIRAAIVEFEKLPLEQDLPILRNILYEGVKIPIMKKRGKE